MQLYFPSLEVGILKLIWSHTPREKNKRRVSENKGLRRIFEPTRRK
jgi:hypothetical protein